MKRIIFTSVLTTMVALLTSAGNYSVRVFLPEEMNGKMAKIINFDNSQTVDSALVENGEVTFLGSIEEAIPARLIVDGNKMNRFMLESGTIVITDEGEIAGGRYNERNNAINKNVQELYVRYQNAETEEQQEAILNEYNEYMTRVMNENLDNPIGYLIFLDKGYEMAPEELEKFVADNPYFTKYQRVNKLLEANRNKIATSEGKKFVDFEIEYEGQTHRLSDVVGKGDYVLVDFWASWCGPCIRQTVVLKDIYKEYKDKGLKILGVAVWDEPENTLRAIEQHELPWVSWLNGQSVPTDIYGISGIPCIILFGPDGTILSRDKQSDELKADVAKYVNG